MISIENDVYYIPHNDEPLSGNVGIVFGQEYVWIYDVGTLQNVAEEINAIPQKKNIVLSHFHPDHITNLSRLEYDNIYLSSHTLQYTHKGTVILDELSFQDGRDIHIFTIPSCHAKGCVGMRINNQYAFVGDALYPTKKKGQVVYNSQLLLEQIRFLQKQTVEYLLISHADDFLQKRSEVIDKLEAIYKLKKGSEPYILLENSEILS